MLQVVADLLENSDLREDPDLAVNPAQLDLVDPGDNRVYQDLQEAQEDPARGDNQDHLDLLAAPELLDFLASLGHLVPPAIKDLEDLLDLVDLQGNQGRGDNQDHPVVLVDLVQ